MIKLTKSVYLYEKRLKNKYSYIVEKEVSAKQEQIEKAAKELFWKYGIRKVTTEEICREAGVSKMTFYKYFKNKIALAVQIFKDFGDELYDYYDEMINSHISFEKKLEQLIMLKLKAAENMSMEFIRDLYSADIKVVREMVDQMLNRSAKLTEIFIELGKKEGSIRKDMPNEFILFQLNQIVEMMRNDKLFSMFDNSKTLTRTILDYFFYGIMNPPENAK